MIDLSTFLMRWFFLCNLIRDVAEIQTLPYSPLQTQLLQQEPILPQGQPVPVIADGSHPPQVPQQQHHHHPQTYSFNNPEEQWRDGCLRGILSYPPGTQRRLVMDAMRYELVHQLTQYLQHVDTSMQRIRQGVIQQRAADGTTTAIDANSNATKKTESVPIQLVSHPAPKSTRITKTDVEDHRSNMKQIRESMPQLVSAVLKSPAPFDPNLVDPIGRLRELIIARCQADPAWGIELCWLLEAEVGRAWRHLFEHKQQTGKRLIIVLPAEKAAVLAQIGPKKREAFDLLQDAEKVTAYGYASDNEIWQEEGVRSPHPNDQMPRLPSSISLLRCNHFGDTMQFIDRLTQISLDMTRVPAIHRHVRGMQCPIWWILRRHVSDQFPLLHGRHSWRSPYTI